MLKLGGVFLTLLLCLVGLVPAHAATYTTSRCGNSSGRVLLTFDDWAYQDPYEAVAIGDYLKGRGVRAAFFLINEEAEHYPDIVSDLRRQGHLVLNHTYSHRNLTTLSDAGVRTEISKGIDSNRLRPPYGKWDTRVSNIALSLGYRICYATVYTKDTDYINGQLRSAASIRARVRAASDSAKTSGVVIGHLKTNYPDAIPGIIDDLHADGFKMCRNRGPAGIDMPYPMRCDPL